MSEITGNLLVYVHCRVKPSTENLAFIAQVFAKTAADLGITCGSAQVDSAGKTARIRVGGVTGFTDVNSAIYASSTSGVLFIDIREHPGGFGPARAEAVRMAGRLVGATGWPLGEAQARTRRKVACSAAWPVPGQALPRISAEFTPAR